MTRKSQPVEGWCATVLTLFPEMFPGPLAHSLAGQARASGIWHLETVDIRTFARDKHRVVDDSPYGGGPGMVMRPDILAAAIDSTRTAECDEPGDTGHGEERAVVYFTPRGRPLDQARVRALAAAPGLVMICGRFEGVDERVLGARGVEEVSLGDFVLSGGEPAAVALIDACVRLLPGVVGKAEALEEESFTHGLLEYPQYTRPAIWEGHAVPEVLLSGHHGRIDNWRRRQAERVTEERRPDLWRRYARNVASPLSERPMNVERPDPGCHK